ncbi:hypothetical protein FH972_022192 [Carpinus fangiana]|uniref:Uncharacterized protein n=1 Tax=Carpinus fangiana TaxID=176857 RepID=A0A5N6KS32_9ROSI|nr:hypothetical protein FH972_022192 [Carpinus fangiana]
MTRNLPLQAVARLVAVSGCAYCPTASSTAAASWCDMPNQRSQRATNTWLSNPGPRSRRLALVMLVLEGCAPACMRPRSAPSNFPTQSKRLTRPLSPENVMCTKLPSGAASSQSCHCDV